MTERNEQVMVTKNNIEKYIEYDINHTIDLLMTSS